MVQEHGPEVLELREALHRIGHRWSVYPCKEKAMRFPFSKPPVPAPWFKRVIPSTPLGMLAMGACFTLGNIVAEVVVSRLSGAPEALRRRQNQQQQPLEQDYVQ